MHFIARKHTWSESRTEARQATWSDLTLEARMACRNRKVACMTFRKKIGSMHSMQAETGSVVCSGNTKYAWYPAVPGSNPAPPQPTANSVSFLGGLTPGMAQWRGYVLWSAAEVPILNLLRNKGIQVETGSMHSIQVETGSMFKMEAETGSMNCMHAKTNCLQGMQAETNRMDSMRQIRKYE
jgi:hypothetical protein